MSRLFKGYLDSSKSVGQSKEQLSFERLSSFVKQTRFQYKTPLTEEQVQEEKEHETEVGLKAQ